MSYLKKVETKEQPKAEYGWIVNPVINVDKLPRVSKEDININEIFEKLTTEEEPKARGELIHQSFQAIMSSSYLGKKTSDQQSNLQLMKEMAKLSDRNANAIQNGTHFMAILHAKGFSLMFLEETIKLPDGKHKRMDAMFYNQELDTLFVIDWKTGYSCDSSALDTLSLYANRMKELNTKTKIGMFLVYVDYGVVLPGWLAPKTKNKGIKGLEPNFMKFLYYNFSEGYEMDYALFSEENVAEDLILHAIPAEFKLAGKPLCLEDLSDSEIRPFGTLGDYDKKTTRSGKEYKNPQNSNEEHKAQEIVFIEQIPLVNSAEKGSSTKHEVKKEKTEIAIVLTKQTSSPTPSHSPKKKSSPNKSKAKDQNTEEEKSESPLSSPDSSPTKTTRVKKENVENSPYWNLICEEDSLLRSAAKHNIPAEELNTFFIDNVVSIKKNGQSFWKVYKEKIDSNLLIENFEFKQEKFEEPKILKSILNKYKIDEIKAAFPSLRGKVKGADREEFWYSLFPECVKGDSAQIKWFFDASQSSKKGLTSFYSKLFYIGIKYPSSLKSVPEECLLPLSL